MTRSVNTTRNPDADYTINDMGVPDRYTSKRMWKHHTPEWEGMSNEEKKLWLENNQDKMEEMRLDLIV